MNLHDHDKLRDARARLLARGGELRDRIQRVRADLRRERAPLPRDSADAAIAVENDEVLAAIESTAVAEIHHIDRALESIAAGTFGMCESCGDFIDRARLEAVPYAVRCPGCERQR